MPESVAEVVTAIAEQSGMREGEIVKRVFSWLHEQDDVIRALVLGQIPDAIRPDAAKLILEQIANGS